MALLGYEITIHRSLTEPILIAGVPRVPAVLNGTFVAAMGLALQSWSAVPLGLLFHLVAVAATKTDPQFFDCLKRHLHHKDYYSV